MVVRFSAALAAMATGVLAVGCVADSGTGRGVSNATGSDSGSGSGSGAETSLTYHLTTLVTNETDPDLINPWGMAPAEGFFWISDNGTGVVSVFDGMGRPSEEYNGRFNLGEGITGVVHVATESTKPPSEQPFLIHTSPDCTELTPAEFIFASENGTLIAINDEAPASGVVVVDRTAEGANFKGVTIVETSSGPLLLAADFVNARVDVFDTRFRQISPTTSGGTRAFNDPQAPEGFGPFNVYAAGDRVYVAYAKIGEGGDEEAGPGLGQISIFDTTGAVISRIRSPFLDAPWGMAVAESPATCTSGEHTLLYVGNFGDGRITVFDTQTLRPLGQLVDTSDRPITIDGLWAIVFGSEEAGRVGNLYFTAGPEEESAGVFGRLEPVTRTSRP